MAAAIIVEGVSSVLGMDRREVSAFLSKAESALADSRGALSRRVNAVLDSSADQASQARQIVAVAKAQVGDFNREAIKFVIGAVGVVWGASVVHAGMVATGTLVLSGLGIAVSPLAAILIGIVAILVCGNFALGVLRELLANFQSEWDNLRF